MPVSCGGTHFARSRAALILPSNASRLSCTGWLCATVAKVVARARTTARLELLEHPPRSLDRQPIAPIAPSSRFPSISSACAEAGTRAAERQTQEPSPTATGRHVLIQAEHKKASLPASTTLPSVHITDLPVSCGAAYFARTEAALILPSNASRRSCTGRLWSALGKRPLPPTPLLQQPTSPKPSKTLDPANPSPNTTVFT